MHAKKMAKIIRQPTNVSMNILKMCEFRKVLKPHMHSMCFFTTSNFQHNHIKIRILIDS